jgi:hypothetical protein
MKQHLSEGKAWERGIRTGRLKPEPRSPGSASPVSVLRQQSPVKKSPKRTWDVKDLWLIAALWGGVVLLAMIRIMLRLAFNY